MIEYIIGGLMLLEIQHKPVTIQPTVEKPLEATTGANTVVQDDIMNYIKQVFGEDSEDALRIASCESKLDPEAKNPNSSATGIFQIIHSTWGGNTDEPFSEAVNYKKNIEVAKTLFDARGWQPWVCH